MEHRQKSRKKLKADQPAVDEAAAAPPNGDKRRLPLLDPAAIQIVDDSRERSGEYELLPDAFAAEELQNEVVDLASMDFSDDLPAYSRQAELPGTEADMAWEPRTATTAGTAATAGAFEAEPVNLQQLDDRGLVDVDAADDELLIPKRRKFWLTAAPAWLISLLVHVGLILILAAVSLEPVRKAISILQASSADSVEAIEEFDLQAPALETSNALDEPLSMPSPTTEQIVTMPELQPPMMPNLSADLESFEMNNMTESIMPSSILSSGAMAQMSVALNSRSKAQKSELLEKFGGNSASEKAVAMALEWTADHQAKDGGWTLAHNTVCRNQCGDAGDLELARNAATAMALLPFLGAGQTHVEGQYKNSVKEGLRFLINRMQVTNGTLPEGSWHEPGGRMYSHGLAAITVCEAYAMTHDPDLLQPAQLSLNYLINAQDPRGGGWRYEPGQSGDTSVVGWCVMALKSGKMGNLVVPQSTFQGANRFLDFVSTNQGAYYGYDKPSSNLDGRQSTIAVGLLCRMYMGVPKQQVGMQEGVKYLSKTGPKIDDLYYSYYATQVLRHYGGPAWEKWNAKLRDDLIMAQEKEGHAAGSWFTGGNHSEKGGRLYSTSLATMILEVYYRHMPLYSEKSSNDDFEI